MAYTPPPLTLLNTVVGPYPSNDQSGVTDAGNLQSLIEVAAGKKIVLPGKDYYSNTTVMIDQVNIWIQGAGKYQTFWHRVGGGTCFLPEMDFLTLSDFSIDGGLSGFPASASHGISAQSCNHFLALRLSITNYLNSAILCQGTPSRTFIDNVIEDCICDGGNAANNGFLIANLDRSGMRGCRGENIRGGTGPGYACQVKDDSRWCFIDDCDGYNSLGGLVLGFDATTANGPIACRIGGGSAVSCDGGILLGAAANCVADGIDIWMTTNVNDAIRLQGKGDGTNGSVGNCMTGITVHGVGASRACVRFDDVSTDNMITLDVIDASGSTGLNCTGSSDRNTVEVKKYVNAPTHELANTSTGTQNRIRRVEDRRTLTEIGFGAITQSFDRALPTAALAMTSQQPYYIPIYLYAGETITNVIIHLSTNGGAPTNFFVGLYNIGLTRLAVSTDQAATISSTTGQKVLPLSAAFTILDSGIYYVGLLNNGGTLSPLGLAASGPGRIGANPFAYAQDTSTTSTTLPSPGTIAAGSKAFWVEVD